MIILTVPDMQNRIGIVVNNMINFDETDTDKLNNHISTGTIGKLL